MNPGKIDNEDVSAHSDIPSNANGAEVGALQRLLDDDHAWATNDLDVQRRYEGQMIAVHHRQVIGVGPDLFAALEDARARPSCPPRHELSLVRIDLPVADADSAFAWCLEDATVQREHGGMVAVIHGRSVLALGQDRASAWRETLKRTDCPAEDEVRFVIVPTVREPDISLGFEDAV